MSTLLESIIIEILSSATTFTYALLEDNFDVPDNSDEVSLAAGFSRRRGTRKTLSGAILDPAAITDLETHMAARELVKVTLNYAGGTTDAVSPLRFTATPIMSPVADLASVFIAADGTAADPATDTTGAWTELGGTIGGAAPDLAAETIEDGEGRPYYKHARLVHMLELSGKVYSTIKTYETNGSKATIAIEHPDGTYRMYRNVYVEARYLPHPGSSSVPTVQMRIFGAQPKFSDLIEFPSAMENLFYGVQLEAGGFAYTEGNLITTTNV